VGHFLFDLDRALDIDLENDQAAAAELFFDDVCVPVENLLGGKEGQGFFQLMEQLPQERLIIAVQGVAAMERALAETLGRELGLLRMDSRELLSQVAKSDGDPALRGTAMDDGQTGTDPAFDEGAAAAQPFPEVLRSARRGLPIGEDEGGTPARGRDLAAPGPFAPTISYTPPPPFDDDPATAIPGLSTPVRESAQAAPEPASIPAHEDERPVSPHEPDLARLDANYGRPRKETHPLVRALAMLLAVGLSALLAAQATYLYRMELARALPGLRPVLSEDCARLGCGVPYPRDAEHIAIEASDLQAEPGRPGYYLLQATLNNRADYPQQWPHLKPTPHPRPSSFTCLAACSL